MSKFKCLATALLLILILAAGVGPLHAQKQGVVLQLAVPGYMEDMFKNGVLDQFEAEHPGVRVELVTKGGSGMVISMGSSTGQGDIKDELDERQKYASSADVLAISSNDLSPEVTRAGFFLDLAPLVNSDPELNSADFYTAVWQSFQWDGGTWALPAAADPILLFYDKAAFDAAGLPYPDTWRNIHDADMAIRALTKFNADGTVASPGFMDMGIGNNYLGLALLGHGVYDDSVVPSVPNFTSPDLEDMLTTLAQMQADGLFNPPVSKDGEINLDAPLQIAPSAFAGGMPGATPKTPALLPGGRAGLDVSGFAISSGTQNPEAAYELVKFLINHPQVAGSFIGSTPARRDLTGTMVNTTSEGMSIGVQQSPELAALVPVALDKGFPTSETRFSEYLSQAVRYMVQDKVDAHTALQDMQNKALDRLKTASDRRESTQIVVQTPLPTGPLPSGKIALKFGVSSFITPLPNQDQWDAFAADFAAHDPEVGAVRLDSGFPSSLDDLSKKYDCFFSFSNLVPSANLGLLRSLDPLLATDPSFDPNDMVNSVMQQVQRDGQTWALPVMIQPLAMRYSADLFAQAGAVPPTNGWTVEDFDYALHALKKNPNDPAPFVPRTFSNTHLLMLIAAYGGLPLDYRTNPVTINFTDPATVAAIRQVLDLAKNGYMDYSKLISQGGVVSLSIGDDNKTPLYTESLNGIGGLGGGAMVFVAGSGGGTTGGGPHLPQNHDALATFPVGSTYTAVSYDTSAAYISANTPYTEACYRFISELAGRPDLITGMPARRSMIHNPDIATAQGQDVVTFYQAMDALMQKPNTVIIPTGFSFDPGAMGSALLTFWLNRAFDRYVKEDANLDTELADAERFTKDYQNCIVAIPPYDPASGDFRTYYQQFSDCAVSVDPSTAEYFGR